MAEDFPNLGKGTDIQFQEAQRVPNPGSQRDPHEDTWELKWQKVKRQS